VRDKQEWTSAYQIRFSDKISRQRYKISNKDKPDYYLVMIRDLAPWQINGNFHERNMRKEGEETQRHPQRSIRRSTTDAIHFPIESHDNAIEQVEGGNKRYKSDIAFSKALRKTGEKKMEKKDTRGEIV